MAPFTEGCVGNLQVGPVVCVVAEFGNSAVVVQVVAAIVCYLGGPQAQRVGGKDSPRLHQFEVARAIRRFFLRAGILIAEATNKLTDPG
jgi:hypothetical protein